MKKNLGKPSLQIYRPPVFRGKNGVDQLSDINSGFHQTIPVAAANKNVNAKKVESTACKLTTATPKPTNAVTNEVELKPIATKNVESTASKSTTTNPKPTHGERNEVVLKPNAIKVASIQRGNTLLNTSIDKVQENEDINAKESRNGFGSPNVKKEVKLAAPQSSNGSACSNKGRGRGRSMQAGAGLDVGKPGGGNNGSKEPVEKTNAVTDGGSDVKVSYLIGNETSSLIEEDRWMKPAKEPDRQLNKTGSSEHAKVVRIENKDKKVISEGGDKVIDRGVEKSLVVRVNDGLDMGMSHFNLSWFPKQLAPYVRTTILDPGSVDKMLVGEVAKLIINQAMNHVDYSYEAVHLCKYISIHDPDGSFKLTLIACLQQLYGDREKYRQQANRSHFVSYIMLLRHMYVYMRDLSAQMLWDHLFDCLLTIIKAHSSYQENEVRCVVDTLTSIGHMLDTDCTSRMNGLLTAVRDALFRTDVPAWSKVYLLRIVELRSCRWRLKDQVVRYYEDHLNG